MEKGDCFLMKGLTTTEPMTLYYITDKYEDKVKALRIYIGNDMVQALTYDSEFDDEIPVDALYLPFGTYSHVIDCMKSFLAEIKSFLRDNVIDGEYELKVGGHYYDGYIQTITSIGETRAKYTLFRLEEENISPCWKGDGNIDTLLNSCRPITDEVYNEAKRRYFAFVNELRDKLCNKLC